MRHSGRVAIVAVALVAAACADGEGDGDAAGSAPSTTATTPPTTETVPTVASSVDGSTLDGVVLARALVQGEDLPGFEERSVARPFSATEDPGLLICGEDLRAEAGLVDGVRSVLVDGAVQVTATVTAAADANAAAAFVERFAAVAGSCAQPWTQEAELLGQTLEAEVTGPADVGDPGVPVSAYGLRTTTELGSSDVVAAVFAVGPIVSAVTVAGPLDAELGAADAVGAAARRGLDLAEQLG